MNHVSRFAAMIGFTLASAACSTVPSIGPALPLARVNTRSGTGSTQHTGQVDLALLNVIKSIGGKELRVGNTGCPALSETGCVQLYKAYPAQVALCVDAGFDPATDEYKFNSHVIFGAKEVREQRREEAEQTNTKSHLAAGRALMRARLKWANGGGGTESESAPPSIDDGAMPQVTASLHSVILGADDCKPDEIVLGPRTEESLCAASGDFAEVEWRSISEAIQYLGAVVRNEETTHVPTWHDSMSGTAQTLIKVLPGDGGLITVAYLGRDYSVPAERKDGGRPNELVTDHGLKALAMLNELIGTAKMSGNVPVPQPVQFVIP
jgi:hypothetical protein